MSGPCPSTLSERAASVLRTNDRGGYTVPSPGLYPFQWNWDSAFTALGWARLDEARAWQELHSLLEAQWRDGMVPHIVFREPNGDYFPGPEVWGTDSSPPTSGISQPPVAASIARLLVERARDVELAERACRPLLPRLYRWHRWYHRQRDPRGEGLVFIVHPWESGMDNSPAFDEPLRAVPARSRASRARRDLQHVQAAERPTDLDYDRYLHLVEWFRERRYRPEAVAESPFLVADLAVNFILLRADRDLLWLARRLEAPLPEEEIAGWIARSEAALRRLRDPRTGFYHPLDGRRGRLIGVRTHAAFLALWAGLGDALLIAQLERWTAKTRFALSSVEADDPRFEPRRYWRGPVWPVTNFLIAEGALRAGAPELAARLCEDLRQLVERSGFREYFDPCDGRGLGGERFAWTAAIWLWWIGPGAERQRPVAPAPLPGSDTLNG